MIDRLLGELDAILGSPLGRFKAALFLMTVLLLLYGQGLTAQVLSSIDDEILLSSVKKIRFFWTDYKIENAIDFQPVRDLTFHLDLVLEKVLGFHTLKLTNFLIFWLFQLFFFLVLRQFGFSSLLSATATLILSAHPVNVTPVLWISARKHLLAAMFIMATTLVHLRLAERDTWVRRATALYFLTLSGLSQTIYLLWGFWALAHWYLTSSKRPSNKDFIYFTLIFIISLSIIKYNFYYYYTATIYPGAVNVGGKYNLTFIGNLILAYSRYTLNAIAPFWTRFYYSAGSWTTFIGIIPLAALTYRVIRFGNGYQRSMWLLSFISIAPVTVHIINNFVHDTYALVFTAFTTALILYLSWEISTINRKTKALASLLVFILFFAKSYLRTMEWADFEILLKNNFEEEINDPIVGHYMSILFQRHKIHKAIPLLAKFIETIDEDSVVPSTIGLSIGNGIYMSQNLTNLQRLRLYASIGKIRDTSFGFHWALTLYEMKQDKLAYETLREFMPYIHKELRIKNDILALYYILCETHGSPTCMHAFMETKTKIKINEAKFQNALKKLKNLKRSWTHLDAAQDQESQNKIMQKD